jgi:hypothetical protein
LSWLFVCLVFLLVALQCGVVSLALLEKNKQYWTPQGLAAKIWVGKAALKWFAENFGDFGP